MSRREPEPARPSPFDPEEPSLRAQFDSATVGSYAPARRPARRPFHPTKCAFMSADVLAMAASGMADAIDFVEALLDVAENQNGGRRPAAQALAFVVNTSTPSGDGGWVYATRLTAPFVANVRLVKAGDGGWSYVIERTNLRLPRRPAPADRPLHPRRHRDGEPPEAAPPTPAELYAPLPPGERFLDL